MGTVITVTLPPSTTFDSGSLPVGWTAVDNGDGTVTITTTNSLEPGETVDLPIVVNVDPAVEPGTSLEFGAETTSATPDASADNNSATSDTSVIGLADLVLTKDGPTTATAGSLITYTIVVTNNGPSTSQSVDVKDQLPVGVSLDNATVTRSGTGNSACGGTVCQVGDMAVNEVITVTVVGRVNPDVADGTVLTNTATVFSDTPDPVSGNNSDPATTTISTLADVAVTKVDLTDPVGPTEQYLYEIVVTNNGPSIARSVRVTDTLDIRTTFLSASDGCALTVPGGHTVVCAVGDLGPDQSKRYLLAVRAGDVTSGTVFLNSVEATSPTADANLGNNTDTEQTTVHVNVGPTADLELVKTGSPATVVAGQRLTYTIVVTNHGPVQARQVQVLDSLPAEVTLIRATPSMGVCAGATCVLGDMAVGSSATVTVVVRVNGDVADGTTILNVALASSPTADAGNYPNYDTETTPVQAVADLFVTKSHTGAVLAGRQMVFNLTVGNNGPSTAENVVVTDTLPAGVTYVTDSDSCVVVSSGPDVVRCAVGNILAGGRVTFQLTVALDPALDGSTLTNTAQVGSDTPDTNLVNNTATDPFQPTTSADLRITKMDTPDPVVAGQQITYTLTVVNNGPGTARNVVVTDTMPVSVTHVSNTDSCVVSGSQTNGGQILTCSLGDMANGASVSFQILAQVDQSVKAGSSLFNTAVVGSSTPDANPDNNTATAPTVVVGSADMAISKTGPDGPVVAGETLTYTIVITNNGPSLAEDVDVKDFVPAGMSLVNATISSTGGQCMAGLCQLGDVDAGEVQTITVVTVVGTDVLSGTLLENSAQVFTDSTDPNPINNVDSWTNPVGSRALISVQKRDLNDPIGPENLLFYVIDVTNAGPSDAQNVIVTDTLDSRTTYTSDTDSCVQGPTGTLTCSLGTVAAGATKSFILTVRADTGLVSGTVLLNNVTVTTTTPVDAGSTLTDTEETTVNVISGGAVDLAVTKIASQAIAGETMVYTIVVTNNGPSPATGVEVLDTLPAEVSLIAVTASQGLCDTSIFCLLGGMRAGARRPPSP